MELFFSQFHWLRPQWLLLLIPCTLLFYSIVTRKNEQHQWRKAIDPRLLPHLLDNTANLHAKRSKLLPNILQGMLYPLCIVALAGPTWERLPQPSVQSTQPMIVVADLTLSMHANDIQPSRLIRMRYKLLELMKQRKEGQTALIAYSGDAHVVSPLTDDAKTIAALVPTLTPEIMPTLGSNAAAAFVLTESLIEHTGGQIKLVWFTDEALPRDIAALKKLTKQRKIELFIVGIGSAEGGPIRLPSGKFLQGANGQTATAKLDEPSLRALARKYQGSYLPLQNDNSDIEHILDPAELASLNSSSELDSDEKSTLRQYDSWQDRGALLCLLIIPLMLPLFRRGWSIPCVLLLASLQADPVQADPAQTISEQQPLNTTNKNQDQGLKWQDLWQTRDQQAAELRRSGDLSAAAERFLDPEWQGVTQFENKNYAEAADTFATERALNAANQQQLSRNHYNRGHALAHNGQLQEAINSYDTALKVNSEFEDAKTAKAIIENLLRQQQEKEKQQDQQNQSNNDQSANEESEQGDNENNKDSPDGSDQNNPSQNNSDQDDSNQQDSESTPNDSQQKNDQPNDTDEANEPTIADQEADDDHSQKGMANAESIDALSKQEKAQLQQWLSKIKDDPGGLLRRKFMYERQLRERQGKVVETNENGKIW